MSVAAQPTKIFSNEPQQNELLCVSSSNTFMVFRSWKNLFFFFFFSNLIFLIYATCCWVKKIPSTNTQTGSLSATSKHRKEEWYKLWKAPVLLDCVISKFGLNFINWSLAQNPYEVLIIWSGLNQNMICSYIYSVMCSHHRITQ